MFDTHCHLQFEAFQKTADEVVERAEQAGITQIMVPSTDVVTSKKAVEIAQDRTNVHAAVGIHPHHIFQYQILNIKNKKYKSNIKNDLEEIEKLLQNKNVLAVGEIGVDRYYYRKTRHINYQITEEFITLQKEVLRTQIDLALKYKKSLILHNREAKADLLEVLRELRVSELTGLGGRTVFHCCEPDKDLLEYAQEHKFFIGVDGDVTYSDKKAAFIKTVPLEMLVLETDSPFLTPEPYRSQVDKKGRRPKNEPKNLKLIAEYIAHLRGVPVEKVISQTTENANKLFGLTTDLS